MADTTPKLPSDFVLPLPQHQPPSPTPAPHRVGDYTVLRELSRGGMGVVYLAHDSSLDRHVVLKLPLTHLLHAEDTLRFLQEARTAARLRHPAVVPVHHIGQHQGRPFLVMDFLPGGSLHDLLKQHGPLPSERTRDLTRRLAHALQHLHQHGVLHRDLKPHNVLLDQHGHPHLTDFGLALLKDAHRLTQTGAVLGTPSCMAPEQARGERHALGPHTDVYGLGAILYACLTGRTPFAGSAPMDTLHQVIHDPPTPPRQLNPDVDPDLEALCLRCLAKQPHQRPTLDDFTAGPNEPSPAGLRRVLRAAGIATCAGLGLWAVLTTLQPTPTSPQDPPAWLHPLQRAHALHGMGHPRQAAALLRDTLDATDDPQGTTWCARALTRIAADLQDSDPRRARDLLHTALQADPNARLAWKQLARHLLHARAPNDARAAIAQCEALDLEPHDLHVLRLELTLLELQLDPHDADLRRALAAQARAVANAAETTDAELLLASQGFERAGDLHNAERALSSVLAHSGSDRFLRSERSRIRLLKADYHGARADGGVLLHQNPDDPAALAIVGLSLARRGLPGTRLPSPEERAQALSLLARLETVPLGTSGLFDEARAVAWILRNTQHPDTLTAPRRTFPDTLPALLRWIHHLCLENQYHTAFEQTQHALVAFPGQPNILSMRAMIAMQFGRLDVAQKLLDQAEHNAPQEVQVHVARVELATHRRDYDAAFSLLDHAERLLPEPDANLQVTRAVLLARTGRTRQARTICAQILAEDSSPYARSLVAQALAECDARDAR